MQEREVRFNQNLRLEIGRIDRKTARFFIKEIIASYGRLITSNWGLSRNLGIKFYYFSDLKIEAEDATAAGKTVIPVDCGLGLDFWFKFKEPKSFKVLKKHEGMNFPCYFIFEIGKADARLVKTLNRELAPLIRGYLNNRLYGYSVELYADAQGNKTHMIRQGIFPTIWEAQVAATSCFPSYKRRDNE